MAKGIGLIGNFKGKVGNTVGYKLTASNNGQTQGIRVYQPVVKNPKSAGQAEQRAKLLAVNATYRALKMVIDRGNEGLPYGNKSRLAWLKSALSNFTAPWFEKGATVSVPMLCPLTKGTLPGILQPSSAGGSCSLKITYTEGSKPATVGALSTILLSDYTQLKNGDQLTFVTAGKRNGVLNAEVASIVIDKESTQSVPADFNFEDGAIAQVTDLDTNMAAAIIVSREGDNGQHMRSTVSLTKLDEYDASFEKETAKAAAIASYQSSAASNSDWAEESIQ